MHETTEDLQALQQLLDQSYAKAGPHLLNIITPERTVTAAQLSERLTGMCLLALATSTADGRPIVGPVDGIFHRGAFHFGSARDSVKAGHIRRRPHVSATHLPGEEFAVTVHGRAVEVDLQRDEGFRATLLEVYAPRYGADWEQTFLEAASPLYWRIEAERMFTFQMDPA